jgi:hypothetical protein
VANAAGTDRPISCTSDLGGAARINEAERDTAAEQALAMELASARRVLAEREREMGVLEAEVLSMRNAYTDAARVGASAEQQVLKHAAVAERLRGELDALRSACDDLRGEIEHAGRRLVDVAVEREVALNELTVVRGDLERRNAEFAALTRSLGEVDEYIAFPVMVGGGSGGVNRSARGEQSSSSPSSSPQQRFSPRTVDHVGHTSHHHQHRQSTPQQVAPPPRLASLSSPGSTLAKSMLESLG